MPLLREEVEDMDHLFGGEYSSPIVGSLLPRVFVAFKSQTTKPRQFTGQEAATEIEVSPYTEFTLCALEASLA